VQIACHAADQGPSARRQPKPGERTRATCREMPQLGVGLPLLEGCREVSPAAVVRRPLLPAAMPLLDLARSADRDSRISASAVADLSRARGWGCDGSC
jgi:hypothetical protein